LPVIGFIATNSGFGIRSSCLPAGCDRSQGLLTAAQWISERVPPTPTDPDPAAILVAPESGSPRLLFFVGLQRHPLRELMT